MSAWFLDSKLSRLYTQSQLANFYGLYSHSILDFSNSGQVHRQGALNITPGSQIVGSAKL